MPVGRKRQIANFERRTKQFIREIELRRAARDSRYGNLFVGKGVTKGLIHKQNLSEFHQTAELNAKLKQFYRRFPTEHFVPVFPHHSQQHPVQEHFHAPTMYSLLLYLGYPHVKAQRRDRIRDPQRALCKNIVNNPANKQLNTQRLVAAYTEFVDSMRLVIGADVKYIHRSNVIVLGCTKDGRIRLSVIDAI